MIPPRIYDQPISYIHAASESWLREIDRADFNSAEDIAASGPASTRAPAATEAGRSVQPDAVSQDREPEVAA